jgi:hypothetical protein
MEGQEIPSMGKNMEAEKELQAFNNEQVSLKRTQDVQMRDIDYRGFSMPGQRM